MVSRSRRNLSYWCWHRQQRADDPVSEPRHRRQEVPPHRQDRGSRPSRAGGKCGVAAAQARRHPRRPRGRWAQTQATSLTWRWDPRCPALLGTRVLGEFFFVVRTRAALGSWDSSFPRFFVVIALSLGIQEEGLFVARIGLPSSSSFLGPDWYKSIRMCTCVWLAWERVVPVQSAKGWKMG